jgi:parallel beta-helix repeat protein
MLILSAIVIILFVLAMLPYREVELETDQKEEREVWEITGEEVIRGETVILESDLVIKDGGKLILDDAKLIMDNSGELVSSIQVEKNGEFYINNSNISVLYPTKYHDFGSHHFSTYGYLEIRNSTVICFTVSLYSDDVMIIDSEISSVKRTGIYIKGCSPQIIGNWVHDNKIGVQINDADPIIRLNNISSNSEDGIQLYRDSNVSIYNNFFSDNSYGISMSRSEQIIISNNTFIENNRGISSSLITNGTIVNNYFNNKGTDIFLYESNALINKCNFTSDMADNIDCRYSTIDIGNCIFWSIAPINIYNSTGYINDNFLYGNLNIKSNSRVIITNNSFEGSDLFYEEGISISGSTAFISNNTISEFYYGMVIDHCWMDEDSPIVIKNNKIINSSTAIYSSDSKFLIIQENDISGSTRYDMELSESETRIINSNISDDMLDFDLSTISYEHLLNLRIINENEEPVPACVSIFDSVNNLEFEGTCDLKGQIKKIPLQYKYTSPFGNTFEGPYSIHLKYQNSEISTTVLMDKSKDLAIIMDDLGDLEITPEDLDLSDSIIEENENVNLTARIHNIGSETITNITVSFYLFDSLIDEDHINSIPPESYEDANINWTAIMGDWNVIVIVSSTNKEINRMGNNEASSNKKVVEMAIDSYESYSNETWDIKGDVIIENGGILELDNVTIIMNSSFEKLRWNVTQGGELIMKNCNISAYNDYRSYYFMVYGKAILDGSIFTGMGKEDSIYYWRTSEPGGVQIYSDEVVISNSTIRNDETGIYCRGSSPVIYNNTILENDDVGIYCYNSNATISQNKIHSNRWNGLYVDSPGHNWISRPIIDNNTISGSYTGIEIDSSSALISNNTIYDNSDGIESWDSRFRIINNVISDNYNGIYDVNSRYCGIEDNLIKNNSVGIYLRGSILNITENKIINNEDGIKLGDRNNEYRSVSLIKNNIISSNSDSGILLYGFHPVIENNTIGNNTEWGISIFNGDAEIKENNFEYESRPNGYGRIIEKNRLFVRVTDSHGRHLSDVHMNLTASNGTQIANENLDNGFWNSEYLHNIKPIMYVLDNNGNENYHEYYIEVEKEGVTNSTWFTSNNTYEITLQLALLSDLKVEKIEVGEYFPWANGGRKPKEDDNITVKIFVYNNGNGSAFNISVKTFIDDRLQDEQTIYGIHGKSTRDISFIWQVEPGKHTFEVQMDPHNTIQELNETNNQAQTKKHFDPLPEDPILLNTLLIICFISLFMTFIFWVRWRYETWRRP